MSRPAGYEETLGHSVAMDADGDFVAGWHRLIPDDWEVGGFQVFDGNANYVGPVHDLPRTNEFLSKPPGPDVAVDAVNNSVAVFTDWYQLPDQSFCVYHCAAFGQRYSNTGVPVGGPVVIAAPANNRHFVGWGGLSVASDNYGRFVVAYADLRKIAEETKKDPEMWELSFRFKGFDADWTQILGEQVVYSITFPNYTPGLILPPLPVRYSSLNVAITGDILDANPNNGFVITWDLSPETPPPLDFDVYARRYNGAGVPLTPIFQVNATDLENEQNSDVAMGDDGAFVVAWGRMLWDPKLMQNVSWIYARQYSPTGVAGPEILVRTGTDMWPDVAVGMNSVTGDFVVGWTTIQLPERYPFVTLRHYTPAGIPDGPDVFVNTLDHRGTRPRISMSDDGAVVVTWNGSNVLPDPTDIFGRRLSVQASGAPSGPDAFAGLALVSALDAPNPFAAWTPPELPVDAPRAGVSLPPTGPVQPAETALVTTAAAVRQDETEVSGVVLDRLGLGLADKRLTL